MMDNEEQKDFCITLMKADTEKEVIDTLKEKGYWNRPEYWRLYGDLENNYGTAGNQANEAEPALIEKITNARDAILMNECLTREIDPKSDRAPSGVRDAVAEFFEENQKHQLAGQIKEWSLDKRRKIAQNIAVFVTGHKPKDGYPCINIVDQGEGQTPLEIPKTLLSLGKSIKREISFVHGKWNMGGTAVLPYCGKHNLQLLVSKRNPALIKTDERQKTDDHWGFTIVRRENPKKKETSSTYAYLAPIGSESTLNQGDVLRFSADTLPIFPKLNEPYCKESEWGTLVKLYEYKTRYKQNVWSNKGLLRPLDLLAPDLGLPFRLHECRYGAGYMRGSSVHQVNGLVVRLHDDRGKTLESDYPAFHKTQINGESFCISLYAFNDGEVKKDGAKTYRDSSKAVLFTLNGQSQGFMNARFFSRDKVGLGYLKDALLLIVDCSQLTHRAQEELFINDRCHLREGEFKKKIEEELEDYLARHPGLKKLQEDRRRKLMSERLSDSKPLESILKDVFKQSPTLAKIFLEGQRLSNPFISRSVVTIDKPYEGKPHPSYFKFNKLNQGKVLRRDAEIGRKARIKFETDVVNDYFARENDTGCHNLFIKDNQGEYIKAEESRRDYGLNLFKGIATLNVMIASPMGIGTEQKFKLEVNDPTLLKPFINEFILRITPKQEHNGGGGSRIRPPSPDPGPDRLIPAGIDLPNINRVYEDKWKEHDFDKNSAMKVVRRSGDQFDWYLNMNNQYLEHEIKNDPSNRATQESQFETGMALLSLAMIYDEQTKPDGKRYEGIEDRIAEFSRAISLMIIPMIRGLGSLDLKP